MLSLTIVIDFDGLKYTGLGSMPCHISCSVNEFDFQGVKEAYGDRVIVAGHPASHAPEHTVGLERVLVAMWAILGITIRVNSRAFGSHDGTKLW